MSLESLSSGDQNFLELTSSNLAKPLFGVDSSSIGYIDNVLSKLEDPQHQKKHEFLSEVHEIVEAKFLPPKVDVLNHITFTSHFMNFPDNDFNDGRLSRFRVKFADINCLVTEKTVELGFHRTEFPFTKNHLEAKVFSDLLPSVNLEAPINPDLAKQSAQIGVKLFDNKKRMSFSMRNPTDANKYTLLMEDPARISTIQYSLDADELLKNSYKITIENDRGGGSKPGIGICLPRKTTWNRSLIENVMLLHKDKNLAGEFNAYFPELSQVLTDLCQSEKNYF